MINKSVIENLVAEKIHGTDNFIVDIKISNENKICIILDSDSNISIDNCIEISRHVEHSLDRDNEDFALEVSSAGLSSPILLPRQLKKRIDQNVEVIDEKGVKTIGVLKSVNEDLFTLETEKKKKVEGKKSKQVVKEINKYNFKEVKTIKVHITF